METCVVVTACTDPYTNLAVEEALLLSAMNRVTLFLWQNANTVVIGRHQNAFSECRLETMDVDGVFLARRTTGGGAVYHDLGNLNFSFVVPQSGYSLPRQLAVVMAAVRSFGIDCTFTGRNDLEADGHKFSGNAFRHTQTASLHHGTLLLNADIHKMGRYLSPPLKKLAARGVASVPARVCNLGQLAPVTVDALTEALKDAFFAAYGHGALCPADALSLDTVSLEERNRSWIWNVGRSPTFDMRLQNRFAWGSIELLLTLKNGCIDKAILYTDALDETLAERLSHALTGVRFLAHDLAHATLPVNEDVAQWLTTNH